ncbi:MAG TPA: type II toxin-antitoxin system RatA family toxin [Aestuariivirga sp.]|nr:type II toxin-antitoxin system RatA family toxin [Aestuariivirga sp.]
MPKFSTTHRVDFTPQQIFAVVADVGSYKEFLPLVERSTVRNRKPAVDGNENFGADLLVGYKKMGIQESFSSEVQTSLKDLSVSAVSSGNAVKKLISSWKIAAVEGGKSEITFAVDYEMKSPMLQMVMKGMFDMAARKMLNAFEARAAKLYKS